MDICYLDYFMWPVFFQNKSQILSRFIRFFPRTLSQLNIYGTETASPWKRNTVQHHEAYNDDVIKWKNFPRYWPFVRGIHRWPVNSPHKGQWRGALIFSLIWAWINSCVNNREAGDLRRHHAHYDVSGLHLLYILNHTKADTVVLLSAIHEHRWLRFDYKPYDAHSRPISKCSFGSQAT